jgi:hypothetical protein
MQDEDLYPNDSSYFLPREPADQVRARSKEKAKALQGLAVLRDMIKRFDERIAFYESVSSIPNEVRDDPQKFLIMHNSNTMSADNLRQEKEYIESLLDANS